MKNILKSKRFIVFASLFLIGFLLGVTTGNVGYSIAFGQLAGYWLLICFVAWVFKKLFTRGKRAGKNNGKVVEVLDVKNPAH